jgi:hypothetical protein
VEVRAAELALMHEIVSTYPQLSIHELSLTLCELLGWKRPNGGLKGHECRKWLQSLAASGIISLPAVRQCGPRGPQQIDSGGQTDAPAEKVCGAVASLEPLRIEVVEAGGGQSRLFRQWLQRYHYLGVSSARRSELAIPGAFGRRCGTGLSAVVFASLEDGAARPLDRVE